MYAVRNLRLCTKDCLCLYVCPTGAADTENGQVDAKKCIGCGLCVKACPSHALSLVPERDRLAPQQPKADAVCGPLRELAAAKARQEKSALQWAEQAADPTARQLARAVARSNRLMAEDILREAGYMLPQSGNAHRLLRDMLADAPADFPADAARQLLDLLPDNG